MPAVNVSRDIHCVIALNYVAYRVRVQGSDEVVYTRDRVVIIFGHTHDDSLCNMGCSGAQETVNTHFDEKEKTNVN